MVFGRAVDAYETSEDVLFLGDVPPDHQKINLSAKIGISTSSNAGSPTREAETQFLETLTDTTAN